MERVLDEFLVSRAEVAAGVGPLRVVGVERLRFPLGVLAEADAFLAVSAVPAVRKKGARNGH